MKYDGINWMGWLINIACFFGVFCIFVLTFGYSGIFWFIGTIIAGIIIGLHREPKEIRIDNDDYFTDEDFMHCKIGEWISRK